MSNELLQRRYALENNIDPRGNKWGIGKVVGTALYHVDLVEGNKNTNKPKMLSGRYTNPTLAQKDIEKFLAMVWDENDAHVQKTARKSSSTTTES